MQLIDVKWYLVMAILQPTTYLKVVVRGTFYDESFNKMPLVTIFLFNIFYIFLYEYVNS